MQVKVSWLSENWVLSYLMWEFRKGAPRGLPKDGRRRAPPLQRQTSNNKFSKLASIGFPKLTMLRFSSGPQDPNLDNRCFSISSSPLMTYLKTQNSSRKYSPIFKKDPKIVRKKRVLFDQFSLELALRLYLAISRRKRKKERRIFVLDKIEWSVFVKKF